jgi:5-methylthioadenosine/S-adenosylhomocysteine deaminase
VAPATEAPLQYHPHHRHREGPSARSDLTVFPVADPVATIVSAGHPGLVDTVAGRVVKRDGVLANVDLAALRTRLLESRSRIGAAADVPLEGTGRPQPAAQ